MTEQEATEMLVTVVLSMMFFLALIIWLGVWLGGNKNDSRPLESRRRKEEEEND